MNYTRTLIGALILIVIGGAGSFIYKKNWSNDGENGNGTTTPPVTGTTTTPVVKPPATPTMAVPSLKRPLNFPSTLSAAQREQIKQRIDNLNAMLKANSDDFGSWIELGLERKSINDHEGARQAWEYAGYIRPKNSLSFGNLGFLYGYVLKDNKKAEQNYLKAIENDPKMVYLYIQTAEFYRDIIKDITKARAIVDLGIKNNPDDDDLKAFRISLN